MTRILLLRHGETTSSRLGHFTGRVDAQLTEIGRAQASQWRPALEHFAGESPVEFRSSPLSRCFETAQLAAGVDVEVWGDLAEWDLGTLDGVVADDFRRQHPSWNLFTDGPPDGSGESPEDIGARARRVLDQVREEGRDAVLFTHGQFAKALTATALGLPSHAAARFALGPARAALLMERSAGMSLAGWNLSPVIDRLWIGLT